MNEKARALSAFLCAATALVVFSGSFPLSGDGSHDIPITSNPGDQYSPALYGDTVVWEDTRNGNSDIYGYNLSAGLEFQITTAPGAQRNPAICGNYVVREDRRSGTNALYGYDLVTNTEFLITAGTGSKQNPAVYGDIVVWADKRAGTFDIFGYNLATHQEFQITTDPNPQQNPAIYENVVVWEDYRHSHSAIYGYDLSTGQEFRISRRFTLSTKNSLRIPALYGDIVVWQEHSCDILSGSNLSTSERYRMAIVQDGECHIRGAASWHDPERPAVYGDTVVWMDSRYGNADILGYTFPTGQEFEVTTHGSCQCSPAIYDTVVVWEDNRGGNWDIYATRLVPPHTPTQFTPSIGLLDSEEFFTALFATYVIFAIASVGVGLRSVKQVAVPETSAVHPRDFRRRTRLYAAFWILGTALFGFSVLFYLYTDESLMGFLYLYLPVLTGITFFLKKRIPYIRVTDDGIVLFEHESGKPVSIAWNTIQKAHVEPQTGLPSRVELFLSTGEEIKLDLKKMWKEDRGDFVQTLEQFIP